MFNQESSQYFSKFQVGKTYSCRSIGDHNCIFSFTIINRSANTVTISGDIEAKQARRKIYTNERGEYILPLGNYSMAPTLRAESI